MISSLSRSERFKLANFVIAYLLTNEILWIVAILVIIKLIILAAIVIRYKISKRFQRPVFMFKSMLVVIAILATIIFLVWPEAWELIPFP